MGDHLGLSEQSFTTAAQRSQRLVATVLDSVSTERPIRILDVGCGDGMTLIALIERLPNATGLGVDVSGPNVERAEENRARLRESEGSRLDFVRADIMAWRPQGLFDVICMDSVLQILPGATDAVVERTASLLAPGGIFVHNTPVECLRNRAVVAVRAVLRSLRGPWLDALAFRVARALHKRAWSDPALRERLVYLYLVPERLVGAEVRAELERCGLGLEREDLVEPASPAQLRHTLSVWRKGARADPVRSEPSAAAR